MATTAEHIEYRIRKAHGNVPRAEPKAQQGAALFARAIAQVRRWTQLSRQRRELAQLSDEMLSDIGLSRVDALREAERSFWDDPQNLK